jgi:putative redox protein
MKDLANITWNEKVSFIAESEGNIISMVSFTEHGGENKGVGQKHLLLFSLGGCTGMDVISILRKMREKVDYFNIQVEGELTEEHPKYYKKIIVTYQFKGENLNPENVKKAVHLSEEKYCGVSAMLRKAAQIITIIEINGQVIE